MNLQKAALALALSFVIAFSCLALIQLEKNNSSGFRLNAPSNPISAGQVHFELFSAAATNWVPNQSAVEDKARESSVPLVNNSTRAALYDFIDANPGVQFRGICATLDIAIGSAEFHLGVLKKAGLISFIRDGKYKRFFVSKKFSLTEMKLISLLRHETQRKILERINAQTAVAHHDLASELSISSQGLTWQMNGLREKGIVREKMEGIRVTYTLNVAFTPMLNEVLRIIRD